MYEKIRASLIAQLVKNLPVMQEIPGSIPGLGRSPGEGIGYPLQYSWASLVAQLVKNPPAMQETWVGKIPWRRERLPTPVYWPGEFHGLYCPLGCKESDTTERLSLHFTKRIKKLPEKKMQVVVTIWEKERAVKKLEGKQCGV